jgi:hypothetical protein
MRVPVPFGQGQPSVAYVDTQGKRKGVSVQNAGSVDIFYSQDQRTLDTLPASGRPNAGHILAAAAPVPLPVVIPFFIGKYYFRATSAGASLEVDIWDVDICS